MRPVAAALCGFVALLAAPAVLPAQEFPYQAKVVDDNAYVRSGPAKQYYPTGRLRRGTIVRVVRHDYGGWYAVEPPEGSFSWVDSRSVQDEGDGVGTIISNNVVIRIGSTETKRRDILAGVQQHRGDRVRILGREEFRDGEQTTTMVRILPVKGEERWVPGHSLQPFRPQVSESPGEATVTGEPVIDASWVSEQEALSEEFVQGHGGPVLQTQAVAEAPEEAFSTDTIEDDEQATGPALQPAPAEPKRRQAPPKTPRKPERRPGASPAPARVPPDPAHAILKQAHRRLADIVSGDIARWDLQSPKALYRRALLQGRTPPVRIAARQGLERVARYEALKRNYEGFQRAKALARGEGPIVQAQARRETPIHATPGPAARRQPARRAGQAAHAPRDPQIASPRRGTVNARPRREPVAHDSESTGTAVVAPRHSGRPTAGASRRAPTRPAANGDRPKPSGTAATRPRPRLQPEERSLDHLDAGAADQDPASLRLPTTPSRSARSTVAPKQIAASVARRTPRFDGHGVLQRTAVQGLGAPHYKLADPNGRVRFYVSPALGVDLRPYLKQPVAVVGDVSYRSDLRAKHITVRQVVPGDSASASRQHASVPR